MPRDHPFPDPGAGRRLVLRRPRDGTGTGGDARRPVAAWRVEAGAQDAFDVPWIARDTRALLRVGHADGSATLC